MRNIGLIAAAAAVALAAPAGAAVIDFSTTAPGTYASGTLTVGGVTFSNGAGGNLDVADFGAQSNGRALGAPNDFNSGYIIGDLAAISDSISLAFGNDDQGFTNPGDLAFLRIFLGGTEVGATSLALNRDDIMNQTISLSGISFDRFTFAYTDPSGGLATGGGNANVGLYEVIDNINITGGAVPEPGTWAMMLFGFGAIGTAMRRRRKQQAVFA